MSVPVRLHFKKRCLLVVSGDLVVRLCQPTVRRWESSAWRTFLCLPIWWRCTRLICHCNNNQSGSSSSSPRMSGRYICLLDRRMTAYHCNYRACVCVCVCVCVIRSCVWPHNDDVNDMLMQAPAVIMPHMKDISWANCEASSIITAVAWQMHRTAQHRRLSATPQHDGR